MQHRKHNEPHFIEREHNTDGDQSLNSTIAMRFWQNKKSVDRQQRSQSQRHSPGFVCSLFYIFIVFFFLLASLCLAFVDKEIEKKSISINSTVPFECFCESIGDVTVVDTARRNSMEERSTNGHREISHCYCLLEFKQTNQSNDANSNHLFWLTRLSISPKSVIWISHCSHRLISIQFTPYSFNLRLPFEVKRNHFLLFLTKWQT